MSFVPPSTYDIPERVLERVWDRITIHDWLDCWPWKLSIGSHGYGQVGWYVGGGKTAMTTAHRVVWVAWNGPIPAGMTVDHECRVRRCCNPLHLRLLPNIDNATDNGQGRKTHCPHGHPYDEENTMHNRRGHRSCRACARARREVAR